jgi:hypothetical protein
MRHAALAKLGPGSTAVVMLVNAQGQFYVAWGGDGFAARGLAEHCTEVIRAVQREYALEGVTMIGYPVRPYGEAIGGGGGGSKAVATTGSNGGGGGSDSHRVSTGGGGAGIR